MNEKVIIIAEAGVNHNGDLVTAKKLVDAAVVAGVDYVKFQTFKADALVGKTATKAEYQKSNTDAEESQYQMLKRLELSEEDHHELLNYCTQSNIQFLSTAFDLDSIDLLKSIGLELGKIPSGELTNLPYLRKMAQNFPVLVMSTGMASLNEIEEALSSLIQAGAKKENITLLHCNTEYPTPMADVHLRAMNTLKETFGVSVGYSDHTLGIEVPIAAVALGAQLIEKHFTLDKNADGPDHKASLDPEELKAMVHAIRNIEQALGTTTKQSSASETKNKEIARKSIVAKGRIRKGQIFSEDNLAVKRPGTGISPMRIDEVIGRVATQDFEPDQIITL